MVTWSFEPRYLHGHSILRIFLFGENEDKVETMIEEILVEIDKLSYFKAKPLGISHMPNIFNSTNFYYNCLSTDKCIYLSVEFESPSDLTNYLFYE